MRLHKKAVLAAVLSAVMGVGSAQEGAGANKVKLDIAAQSLGDALDQFAKQSGIQLVYQSKLAKGIQSPKVSGTLTADEALKQLLANTGLKFEYLDAQTVAIRVKGVGASSGMGPAEQMRMADNVSSRGYSQSAESEENQKNSITVKDTKVRPAAGPNLDLPRTMEDVQPYFIYDSEAIQRSGSLTAEDFLKQRVTMNTVAQTGDQGMGARQGAASGINGTAVDLRGLGSSFTLVLINGRRAGDRSNSFGSRLNEIPISMIDRIEILPTSASGIYGGNALGGVVNVVLKRDFTGGTVSVNYDRSQSASDQKRGASASYGWALEGGRTRISAMVNWSDAEPMVVGDRANLYYKSLARITRNYPQYFSTSGVLLGSLTNIRASAAATEVPSLTFLDGTSLGSRVTYVPAGITGSTSTAALRAALLGNRDAWNTQLPDTPQNNGLRRPLAAATSNRSIGFSVQRQIFPWLDLTLDLRRNESEGNSLWASLPSTVTVRGAPLAPTHPTCVANPASANCLPASPFNPFREALTIAFPIDYDMPVSNGNLGITGSLTADVKLPFGWTAMLDYAHDRAEWTSDVPSFDFTLWQNHINDGVLNPFVDAALLSAHDWAQYAYTDSQFIESESDQFRGQFRGQLVKLPWGTPVLSVAVERSISTAPGYQRCFPLRPSQPPTTVPFCQPINGGPGMELQSINSSVFAETLLPLVREGAIPYLHALELQLAGRASRSVRDNSAITDTVSYGSKNYTVGFRYQPIPQATLRVSRATAFLPPDVTQLTPAAPGTTPQSRTITDPTVPGGTGYQIQVMGGGNPDLVPQNSESLNAGVIFQPTGRFSGARLNVEYYKIDQKDFITALGEQTLVNNEQSFPGLVVRDPGTGRVSLVYNIPLNMYGRSTEGMDYRIDYNKQVAIGYLSLSASHTTIRALKRQYTLTQPMLDAVGHPADGGAAENKSTLNLNWERNGWMFTWNATRFGSYYIYGAPGGPASTSSTSTPGQAILPNQYQLPQGGTSLVGAQMLHDMSIGYRAEQGGSSSGFAGILRGTTLRLGVRNVFATEPKLDVSYTGNYWLSPYGSARLRSFWFTAQKAF